LQPSSAIGFSCQPQQNAGHARATETLPFTENPAVEIVAAWLRAVGDFLDAARGHAGPAEVNASWRLLLPLFASQGPGQLRQDVRAAKICVALVGDVMREVTKPLHRG
jgi:hypothetical protein